MSRPLACLLWMLSASLLAAQPASTAIPTRSDRYGDPLPKGAVTRLGTVRFRQPNPWKFAFSPDGKILASGGSDNMIRLWDPDTGKEVRILEGHTDSVNGIAFSADGKWLASGGQDKTLRLWEVETGKERRRFQGHERAIEQMALSPDGKVLASCCQAGTLRVWDTGTGREIRSIPSNHFIGMTFSPDSKYFASNSPTVRGGIQLVDVAEWKVIRTFKGHGEAVSTLVFSADGKHLFSGSYDHTIRVWDVASGKEERRYGDEKKEVGCLALAPDGKTLTYGTHPDGMVHIWDTAANKELVAPWPAAGGLVTSISYTPDSKKVAIGRQKIAIHETATGKRLNPPTESETWALKIEYAPDGKLIAVLCAAMADGVPIEIRETATWRKAATIKPQTGYFTSMAFSPSGKQLTTAESDYNQGVICHWDPKTGKRQNEFPQEKGWIEALSYSADGKTLACYAGTPSAYILMDPATGKERTRLRDMDARGNSPWLSPDGRLVAYFTTRDTVALWDTKTQKRVLNFGQPLRQDDLLLVFSPSGRTIATRGSRGADGRMPIKPDIVLWETLTGRERLHLDMNEGPVRQIAFSRDGRLLAASGREGTIFLWDMSTGKEVGRLKGHRGVVISLAFAPDGKTLASGGGDTTVLVWDVAACVGDFRQLVPKRTPDEMAAFASDLSSDDAAKAYRAVVALAEHPEQAMKLLHERILSAAAQEARVARLVVDLDADKFAVREKASAGLARLGTVAEGALREVLAEQPSAEVRRRANALLLKLKSDEISPELLVAVRTLEVLERAATPEAHRLLQTLADGPSGARLTKEAQAVMNRMPIAQRRE